MSASTWGAAIGGGLVGAVATVALAFAFAPQLVGEKLVREAVLADPEMLVEAGNVLRDKQFAPHIDANRELIEKPFGSSYKGAAKPQVVMVEFFDYACGYCRQTNPDLERLLEENPDLRIVYRELPVLGPDSVVAAKASLAASKAGKFKAYHDALFASPGPNANTISAALKTVGLDMSALEDPSFDAEIQKNYELANMLGAVGTPLFVIGDRVIPAAEGYAAYKGALEAARRGDEDA